jgi:hypothetical protein
MMMPQARVQPVAVRPAEVAAREPMPPRDVMAVPRRGMGVMSPVGLRVNGRGVPGLGAAGAQRQPQAGGERCRAGQEAAPRSR